jgi:hypothetical protein
MSQNRVLVGLPDRLDKCRDALAAAEHTVAEQKALLAFVYDENVKMRDALEKIGKGRGQGSKIAQEILRTIKLEENGGS